MLTVLTTAGLWYTVITEYITRSKIIGRKASRRMASQDAILKFHKDVKDRLQNLAFSLSTQLGRRVTLSDACEMLLNEHDDRQRAMGFFATTAIKG